MMGRIKQLGILSLSHWREIIGVYFIQLVFGLFVGLSFCGVMCSSLDQSMVLDQLAKGFDRTVIMDVMNSRDGVLDGVKSLALSLLGVYLLIGVLLQGGWLVNIKNKIYSLKSLFRNGLKFFFPFLGLALISIILIALFAVVVGISFTKLVGDPLVTFSSEKPYVIWILILSFVFILWLIIIWSWSIVTRLHFIGGNAFFSSIKLGVQTVKNKWYQFLGIGLLLVGIHVVLMFIYYCIMGDRGAPSWGIVVFGILVQQTFAVIRVTLRGFGYVLVEDLHS